MGKNNLVKKALVYTIIGAIVAGNIVPAQAATDVEGGHDFDVHYGTVTTEETCMEQTVSTDETASCEVYAELGSNFIVTIPKKVTLDGATKTGVYSVDVEGDIAGTEVVKVVPDASVALKSTNLADVTATIIQDKTEWAYNEIIVEGKVTGNGTIDATGITAGAWNGTFNFNVELESGKTPAVLEAGLYDANGVMLCSWEESGIDVEMDYSSFSNKTNNYKTATTSPYYVLTNNYPTSTKVVIPDGVTNIGECAFYNCTNLTSVTIPEGVTSIGMCAFSGCTSLSSVTIPEGVTSIGSYAFRNCENLTSIEISEGVTSIETGIFQNCTSLTSITISNNITDIKHSAFAGCTSLTEVVIPESVTSIENSTFSGCTSLSNVTIPDSITSIGSNAFYCCTKLTSITIPKGVTSIGSYAFAGCTSLSSVTIPDSVTSIGMCAFSGCTNLSNVTIPEGVTSIGYSAFSGCTGLSDVTIPDSVTSIESSAFSGCTNLSNVTIPEGVTSIGLNAFSNVPHIYYNGTATGSPWGAKAIN